MVIAVNMVCLQATVSLYNIKSVEEILHDWLIHYQEHRFVIFITPAIKLNLLINPSYSNCVIAVEKIPRSSFNLMFWQHIQLPKKLNKLQAGVLFHPFGAATTSFSTKRPQLLLIEHLLSIQATYRWIPLFSSIYLKTSEKKWLEKANAIVAINESLSNELVKQYPFVTDKISICHPFPSPNYQPISYNKQQETIDKYADGKLFFLFMGGNIPHHNLVGVLKAFSIFKKWQKSNMKLLIAGLFLEAPMLKDDVLEKLSTYKYRDDVVLLRDITEEELSLITASAYSIISPSLSEPNLFMLLNAMQAGTPVIASNHDSVKEIAGTACLYVDPFDVDSLANEIKMIYKDEALRKTISHQGMEQAAKYHVKKTAATIWKTLLSTYNSKQQ